MGAVLQFNLRRDRSQQIAHTIFRHVADGAGVDANITVRKLLNEVPDLSNAEIVAGFAVAHKVLTVVQKLLLDELHGDGIGGDAS